jgi:putative transposase
LEHHIDTGDAAPISLPPFHVSPLEREQIQKEVGKMKKANVAVDSKIPWASRVLFIPKPDGTPRFRIDLRAVNRVTITDRYPLPRMDDFLSRLGGATFFSQIDLKFGHWQMPLEKESRPKTALITPDGLYECTRLPMGLHNGGASFQRLMDLALGNLKWTAC